MSTRKTTFFYVLLTSVASFAVALVIASRLELTPASSAQTVAVPTMNSAPISRRDRRPDLPQHRESAVADGRQHPHRDEGQGAGPAGLLRRRRRRCAGRLPPPVLRPRRRAGRSAGQSRARSRRPQREQTTAAAGTGFIINAKDGFILTNNHVVEDATKIEVQFLGDEDDDTYTAKVIGRDPLTDSALIQLTQMPKHPLGEAKFGDSSQMAAGDWVVAIGNPFGYAHTVTVGVISAIGAAVSAPTAAPTR